MVEKRGNGVPEMGMDTAGRYGIADGIQVIKVVRTHAAGDKPETHAIAFPILSLKLMERRISRQCSRVHTHRASLLPSTDSPSVGSACDYRVASIAPHRFYAWDGRRPAHVR